MQRHDIYIGYTFYYTKTSFNTSVICDTSINFISSRKLFLACFTQAYHVQRDFSGWWRQDVANKINAFLSQWWRFFS